MTLPLKAPVLSYKDIGELAETFLSHYNNNETLPVPIDNIIETHFDIDIVPFPNLLRNYGIDGFINSELNTIYIDLYIFDNIPNRYRFTLSHEIGHLILHKEFMKEIRPLSIKDWKEKLCSIDDAEYSWFEWQANTFAGMILVPMKYLKDDFDRYIVKYSKKIGEVKKKNIPFDIFRD
ncbi:MAG: ImmA/IrrE family metallo-endopeptidase, partial [Nitrospirae bacterium]|nr:ImmA/IrrE family metallo-endopeptidase [Nitrospirota bacterium]